MTVRAAGRALVKRLPALGAAALAAVSEALRNLRPDDVLPLVGHVPRWASSALLCVAVFMALLTKPITPGSHD